MTERATARLPLRIPPELKREIITAAGEEQRRTGETVSTSGWIVKAIKQRLAAERDG
jgi:hypothetical protein